MSLLPTVALLSSLGALSAGAPADVSAGAPAGEALAEPLALEWSAPAECPRSAAVVEAAMALVQEVRLARAREHRAAVHAPQVRASGRVVGGPASGYVLHLAFAGAGLRELPGETCDAIAEVAALLLAIAVEPAVMGGALGPQPGEAQPKLVPPPPLDWASEDLPDPGRSTPAQGDEEELTGEPGWSSLPSEGESERPSEADTGEGAALSGPSSAAPPPAPPDRRSPILGVKALGGLSLGILPSPAAFAGLSLGIEGEHARFELAGSYSGPSRETSAVNPEVGGRFTLWHASLRGCGVLPLTRAETPRLSAPLCAGLHAGAMSGRGEGALIPQTALSPWLGLSLAAALRAQLHRRIALWIDAEGLLSALRPRFHTDPAGTLWQAGRAGARFGLALEIRFDLQRTVRDGQ